MIIRRSTNGKPERNPENKILRLFGFSVGARLAGEGVLKSAFAGKPGSYGGGVFKSAFAGKPGSYEGGVFKIAFAGKPGSYGGGRFQDCFRRQAWLLPGRAGYQAGAISVMTLPLSIRTN